jgi:transcriptional regulator with XRE-family HTH domain
MTANQLTTDQSVDKITPMTRERTTRFSDQLRGLIESSGQTQIGISKATKIDAATLSRFMSGVGGMSIDGLDRLAKHLGLIITKQQPRSERHNQKGK